MRQEQDYIVVKVGEEEIRNERTKERLRPKEQYRQVFGKASQMATDIVEKTDAKIDIDSNKEKSLGEEFKDTAIYGVGMVGAGAVLVGGVIAGGTAAGIAATKNLYADAKTFYKSGREALRAERKKRERVVAPKTNESEVERV